MQTVRQKISHAVKRHAKLTSLCCAVLCAAWANAATFTDVLEVSYEGGLTPMATRTYSDGISTAGITKPDWIGATKLKMDSAAGTTQVGFEVMANTTTSSREWTCTLPLGADTWQITVKQAGKPKSNFGFPKVEQLKGTSFAAWGNPLHLRLSDPSSQPESYDPIYPSYYEGAKPWFHALVVNLGDSAMTKLPDLQLEVVNANNGTVVCSATVPGPIGNVAANGGGVSVYAPWNALAELPEGSYQLRATWIPGVGQTDPDTSDNKATFSFSVEKFVPFALIINDGVLTGWEGECPKKLEIPEGVKAIGSFLNASKGGWDVEEVVLPTSVTEIGDYAFGGFDSLTKVTLPEGLKTIGWGAFECCPLFESISIPSTVEYVDAQAFIDTGLRSVVFHSPNTVFDSMAFTELLQGYPDWIYGLNKNLQSVTLDAPGYRLTGWQLVAVGTADKSKEKTYGATDLGAFKVYPDVNSGVDYNTEHYVVTPVVEEIGTCFLGFPDASTLTDTCGWAAPIVIYDPNDGKAQKDYNAIAKFEKGAGVYFKFVMENKGKTDFPYADFKAEILNDLGIQVAHFTKASDSGTHVAGSIKCSWGWDWPALQNLSAGKYRLQVTLDPESVTGDQDDSDNVAKIGFEVTEPDPDPKPVSYKITYLETKGQGNANPSSYTRDDEIVFKPLPDTVKYKFLGWSPSSIAKGSAGDVTVTARWEEQSLPAPDPNDPDADILDTSVANVLDGSIYNDDYALVGTVQIKTAKANRNSGLSKATATITILGQSKVTVKGEFDASKGVFEAKDKSGKLLSLQIWENDFTGGYGEHIIEGSRNVFSSKKDEDKTSAKEALDACQGTYALTFLQDEGWSALSASVDKKGKVKVSGTLANGAKVAATSQLVVGPDSVYAPIVVSKSNLQLAFGLSFYDGGVGVAGLDDAFCEPVGGLDDGLCFYVDGVEFLFSDDVEVLDVSLPSSTEIKPAGKKWIVSPDENGKAMKAGKVVWDKKEEDVNWDKSKIEGYNVSNLKLSYTAKTGLFKGSFKVYYVENGQKLKTTTFTVNGIVVGGQGYGTAFAKKLGGVPVTIE